MVKAKLCNWRSRCNRLWKYFAIALP